MNIENNCDVGNRDLQLVHEFLVDMYKKIENQDDFSDEDRVKWRHAIHTCGDIGYNYHVTFSEKSCGECDTCCGTGVCDDIQSMIIDELNEDLVVAKRICDMLNRVNDE